MVPLEKLPIRSPFPDARCYWLGSTESTQSLARALAAEAPLHGGFFPAGSLVAADAQSAGRGRFADRVWQGEAGKSLLFTLRLEPGAAALPALALRIGSALVAAVAAFALGLGLEFPRTPRLKWPNDLMFGDLKAGGILCEAASDGLFAGIGLNCNQSSFPMGLEGRATSLARELGLELDRWALLEKFLENLALELEDGDWRTRAEGRLWRRGEAATFLAGLGGSGAGGGKGPISGTVEGIDESGSLLFRAEGATQALAHPSGELRPPS